MLDWLPAIQYYLIDNVRCTLAIICSLPVLVLSLHILTTGVNGPWRKSTSVSEHRSIPGLPDWVMRREGVCGTVDGEKKVQVLRCECFWGQAFW